MEMLCNRRIDCAPGLLTNYSAEGAEPFPPFFSVVFPNPENPIDQEWSAAGCLFLCRSFISQQDADLCAQRQSVLCTLPPGEEIWFSAPATCSAPCPDGTVFFYTVPAGMFIAKTFAEALAQAQAYACLQAQQQRFCIGELPRCACSGNAYSGTVGVDVEHGDLTWTVVGALPPGLTLISTPTSATITGTPLLKGTYAFQLVATDGNNNYAIKTFTIQVVEITTTSITGFTVGTPYSFQMEADGGSGNYSWIIISGVLPDGLTLSAGGLISGTPTAAGTNPILFSVVDLTCEAAQRSNFPPRAQLITTSSTRIETRHGFYEYTTGGTGLLYKRVDYSGSVTQIAFPNFNPDETLNDTQCGGAEYRYSGFDQIDNYGVILSRHRKDLFEMCTASDPSLYSIETGPLGVPNIFPLGNPRTLLGYCWDTDPGSCPLCDDDQETWALAGNFAFFGPTDFTSGMISGNRGTDYFTATPLTLTYAGLSTLNGGVILEPLGVPTFPRNDGFGQYSQGFPFVRLESNGTWTGVLSEPFTDADADASAVTFNGTLAVARNSPNFKSWITENVNHLQSQRTSVLYEIRTTNLIVGRNYIASVQLVSSTGASVIRQYPFTADAEGHDIFDSVPTPAANTTITVRNARIFFAP